MQKYAHSSNGFNSAIDLVFQRRIFLKLAQHTCFTMSAPDHPCPWKGAQGEEMSTKRPSAFPQLILLGGQDLAYQQQLKDSPSNMERNSYDLQKSPRNHRRSEPSVWSPFAPALILLVRGPYHKLAAQFHCNLTTMAFPWPWQTPALPKAPTQHKVALFFLINLHCI